MNKKQKINLIRDIETGKVQGEVKEFLLNHLEKPEPGIIVLVPKENGTVDINGKNYSAKVCDQITEYLQDEFKLTIKKV